MEPLIITAALTGNSATKEKTQYVPITPDEIAEDACRCFEAGACVVHLHARDENGVPSSNPDIYQEIIRKIRSKGCPIISQVSLAGSATTNWQLEDVLNINPQTAGLGAGSINRIDRLNCFEPIFIERMAQIMLERQIAPEMEIFDTAMIHTVKRLQHNGILPKIVKYNLALDVPGMLPGDVETLVFMRQCLPEGAVWGVTALGDQHFNLTAMSIAMGGHARVGIEDSLVDENGVLASNEQQVQWAIHVSRLLGRNVATVDEAKQILGIVLD